MRGVDNTGDMSLNISTHRRVEILSTPRVARGADIATRVKNYVFRARVRGTYFTRSLFHAPARYADNGHLINLFHAAMFVCA